MPNQGTYYAVTSPSGGYAIPATTVGEYQITFSGGTLSFPVVKTVILETESVLLDFIVGIDTIGLKGDVNGDGEIDLEDVVLALQTGAGQVVGVQLSLDADINQDGRIGIPEALFGLQWFSGIRGE